MENKNQWSSTIQTGSSTVSECKMDTELDGTWYNHKRKVIRRLPNPNEASSNEASSNEASSNEASSNKDTPITKWRDIVANSNNYKPNCFDDESTVSSVSSQRSQRSQWSEPINFVFKCKCQNMCSCVKKRKYKHKGKRSKVSK